MHIQNILIFSLIVCSVQISAQSIDCDEIYKSCTKCAKTVPQIDERENNNCSKEVEKRWIWRNLTQCEIQRLYCQSKWL
ncbi:hypothetical protein KR215_005869 [Drosophila sulfurigaster]|nr:hypothetical protein KR215_005869 [Drosophila sulfurigaster]